MFKFNLTGLTTEENTKLSNDELTAKIKGCFAHNAKLVQNYNDSEIKSELEYIPYIKVATKFADNRQRTLSFIALPEKYLQSIYNSRLILHRIPDLKSVQDWYKQHDLDIDQDKLVPMCLDEYVSDNNSDFADFVYFDCVLVKLDSLLDDVITAVFNY